jgi:Ca2+-binding RTX toxin-like protein
MAFFNGTNLRDIINGTSGADEINGNGENDWLLGHGGNDLIRGGSGQDIIEGGEGNDVLYADGGTQVLLGTNWEDVLFGGAGSDVMISSANRDHFNGGSGIDAASWQDSAHGVVANIDTGRATSGGVEDTFTLVENLIGSRFGDTLRGDEGANELFGLQGNDVLYGEGGNDYLSAHVGDDRVYGGDGNDTLRGDVGNDTLDGGAGLNTLRGEGGVDTAVYGFAAGAANVSLRQGYALTDDRYDSLSGIEVVRTSSHADHVEGDDFGNRLETGGGSDILNGFGGDDVLVGGSGADTFVFEASLVDNRFTDPFHSGFDRITDFGAGDRIDLSGHYAATTFAELKGSASQFGTDTHLRLGEDTVVIEDMTLSELSSSMFMF